MSELVGFLERNVKDISYDFIGLILPGIIVNVYIIISVIFNHRLVSFEEIGKSFEIYNGGTLTALFIIFAYFTGLVLHSLYCRFFKNFEKANGNYFKLIEKNIDQLKTLNNKIDIGNMDDKEADTWKKLLFVLQASDENNYITKYLSKRVMYRVMLMASIGVFIENVSLISRLSLILTFVSILVFVSSINMIKSYTNRIVKEITYSLLSKTR